MELNDALKEQLSCALAGFELVPSSAVADGKPLKHAAVALTVIDLGYGAGLGGFPEFAEWQTDSAILLTRRAGSLRSHAGQWALPGGKIDAGETARQAALRELHEEVGLDCHEADILGQLDDVVTRSGYLMTPVVIWCGQRLALSPNPAEVSSAHRIPLTELLRPDAPILSESDVSSNPELRMPIGDSWVAAPTASVLYQFRELCLLGRTTRVSHFEQPRFTWR